MDMKEGTQVRNYIKTLEEEVSTLETRATGEETPLAEDCRQIARNLYATIACMKRWVEGINRQE